MAFPAASPDFRIIRSPKSYNSQMGVPLSVWRIEPEHTLAIFEAGISETREMDRLHSMIRPTIGVLTNIGDAHDEHFSGNFRKQRRSWSSSGIRRSSSIPGITLSLKTPLQRYTGTEPLKSFTWSRKKRANLRVTEIKRAGAPYHHHS